ncbi:MAG: 30S ribosome-binding factor RbfA [Thermomicrobium sp.]|jgi:ribosome-binding factor A|uniref:30S ribosome-binding factor RbfA n=1 Tax=Thermomicrobium sp. TaxID=1969469 RepID=UPI001B23FB30|nr:30S ribosome-binding factor RbfA [Thermomicrobium sp.]MBO9358226.1 30S ribosome-binding factor RbfA [Thermomicrobium sp.]
MPSYRQARLAEFLRDEIAAIIQRELRDPRLGFVSVTRVEMSPDLRHAKVFVSIYGSHEEQEAALEALQGAASFIRRLIAPHLHTRHIPELHFKLDRSLEHAEQVARLLRQIQQERHRNESAVESTPESE